MDRGTRSGLTEVAQMREGIRDDLREMLKHVPGDNAAAYAAALGLDALVNAVLLLGELVECAGLGNVVSLDDLSATIERITEEPRKTA